jgi:hypothetical protein
MPNDFEWQGEAMGNGAFAGEAEFGHELTAESPLDEVAEMELAAELLEITDEAEMDQFLGKLISRAARAAGRFIGTPTVSALGGILKNTAKQVLPRAGQALGGALGGASGSALGGQLASKAASAFGLELEGLSPQDQEFEVAKQFVRFGAAAAGKAAEAQQSATPPAAARSGATAAAQQHAPGLVTSAPASAPAIASGGGGVQSGRWVRRGRKIILLGA